MQAVPEELVIIILHMVDVRTVCKSVLLVSKSWYRLALLIRKDSLASHWLDHLPLLKSEDWVSFKRK